MCNFNRSKLVIIPERITICVFSKLKAPTVRVFWLNQSHGNFIIRASNTNSRGPRYCLRVPSDLGNKNMFSDYAVLMPDICVSMGRNLILKPIN